MKTILFFLFDGHLTEVIYYISLFYFVLCAIISIYIKDRVESKMSNTITALELSHYREITALKSGFYSRKLQLERWKDSCNEALTFLENTDCTKYNEPENIIELNKIAHFVEHFCDKKTNLQMAALIASSNDLEHIKNNPLTEADIELQTEIIDIVIKRTEDKGLSLSTS